MYSKSNYLKGGFKLFILPLMMLTMCRSAQNENKDESVLVMEEFDQPSGLNIKQIKNVYYSIPSPTEMLSMMQGKDMVFNQSLLNPVSNIEYYDDTKVISMNLGIYLTDLAYASMFGRHEAAVDYLEVVRKLSDDLRFQGAINESLIKRARENIHDLDTIFEISNEAFVNMVVLCQETGKSNTLVLITYGALVESLYLATSHVENSADVESLYRHLADQKYSLDNLWAFAQSLSEDRYVAGVITDLEPLEELYNRFEISSGSTTLEKDGAGKLVIGGANQPILSAEEFSGLKEIVTEIRNNIVSRNI